MSDHLRGLVGLIVGVVVGLLLTNLLSDALIRHGHLLSGAYEVVIVIAVAMVGLVAGASTGSS
jgi:hypothetical protein